MHSAHVLGPIADFIVYNSNFIGIATLLPLTAIEVYSHIISSASLPALTFKSYNLMMAIIPWRVMQIFTFKLLFCT